MRRRVDPSLSPQRGFSLVELITVMAIIVIMAAVLLPALSNYIRLYRIRGAMQQVAGDISTARMRAISKNVNLGVSFVIVGNDRYQIVTEDDLDPGAVSPPYPTHWRTIPAANWTSLQSIPAQVGPVQQLPFRVQFDDPANCPGAPGSPATPPETFGLRMSRLGAACSLAVTSCGGVPASTPAFAPFIDVTGSLATICLWQPDTNLRRWLNVSAGGRVTTQP